MLMHKSVDLTENVECSCFQEVALRHKFFLTKKKSFDKHQKTLSSVQIPKHIQDLLGKNSIKKSLKRVQKTKIDFPNAQSPVRNSKILEVQSESQQTFRVAKSCEGISYRDSYKAALPIIKFNTITPPRPKYLPQTTQTNASFRIIQTNPTPIKFTHTPVTASASPCVFKTPQIKFNINSSSRKQTEVTKKIQVQQKQTVVKEQKRNFPLKKKMSLNQNHEHHKKLTRKLSEHRQLSRVDIEEQNSMDFADSLKMETPESPQQKKNSVPQSPKNGRVSIFNSVPLQLKVHKSIIKQEAKNKVSLHHKRMKAFLNTMSEVEEIKSQPDSEDYSDSDKESVVIGNLGNMVRQNSSNFNMNIPQLTKGFQDNQSFESTVMSARIDRNTISKLKDLIM